MRIEDLSPQQIDQLNKREFEKTDREFKEFKADLKKGLCWVCKEPLESFDEKKPCQHWLLMPDGFEKKHLKKLFEARSIDKIEGFLRWYVHAKNPVKGINDIKAEHGGNMLKSVTIKQDRLEWSISISQDCFSGKHGLHGPHYHFQIRVNGKRFHDYGDLHIPLSDYEKWIINVQLGKHPKFKHLSRYGAGIQEIFDNVESEKLLESMQSTDDHENAMFNVQSLVIADEGEGISGNDFADLIEEHKRTGVPMHQLVKKLKNVKTTIIVEPGKGVAEAAPRTRARRRKKPKQP